MIIFYQCTAISSDFSLDNNCPLLFEDSYSSLILFSLHLWPSAFRAILLFEEIMIVPFVFCPITRHYSKFDDLFYIILYIVLIFSVLGFRLVLLFSLGGWQHRNIWAFPHLNYFDDWKARENFLGENNASLRENAFIKFMSEQTIKCRTIKCNFNLAKY